MCSSSSSWCCRRPATVANFSEPGPRRRAHHLHQSLPFLVRVADDHAPVVVPARMRAIGIMRRNRRPTVVVDQRRAGPVRTVARRKASPPRPAPVHREIQQRRTVERNARHHLRQVDMLAAPRHVAMVEAGERTHRPVHAAGIIHVRPAPASRRLVGQAGEMRQPRDRLSDRTERGVMVIATGMAVARHRHIDDVRLDLAQLVIAEAPVPQHARAEILDHDVGDGDQPLHDLQALWRFARSG